RSGVDVEQLADLRQGESQALAAQNQLDARPLTFAVNPGEPTPPGCKEALMLVETDRASREREFLRELGNGIGRARPLGSDRLGVALGSIDAGHGRRRKAHHARSVTIAYGLTGSGVSPTMLRCTKT